MRRNVKFAGILVKRYDRFGRRYVDIMNKNSHDVWEEKHLLHMMNRIRNILEYRYDTIV